MNIHEYQGKAVLKEIGAPVSKGVAIFDASEAKAAAEELGGPLWVVKSQIHTGGRGKGIRGRSCSKRRRYARQIFGHGTNI